MVLLASPPPLCRFPSRPRRFSHCADASTSSNPFPPPPPPRALLHAEGQEKRENHGGRRCCMLISGPKGPGNNHSKDIPTRALFANEGNENHLIYFRARGPQFPIPFRSILFLLKGPRGSDSRRANEAPSLPPPLLLPLKGAFEVHQNLNLEKES